MPFTEKVRKTKTRGRAFLLGSRNSENLAFARKCGQTNCLISLQQLPVPLASGAFHIAEQRPSMHLQLCCLQQLGPRD